MARLGAMLLSLTRAEMRAYFYLIKSAPGFVLPQKLAMVASGHEVSVDDFNEKGSGRTLVGKIRKKLGKHHGISNRQGHGYRFEEERKGE